MNNEIKIRVLWWCIDAESFSAKRSDSVFLFIGTGKIFGLLSLVISSRTSLEFSSLINIIYGLLFVLVEVDAWNF